MKQWMFGALTAMFALTAPAAAQNREPGALPPHDVVGIVRDGGFDPLSQPVRRGPNYVLRAVDEYDREVRVVVSARSGDIVSVTPVATASRMPPGGSAGPYERAAPGYVPAPGPYRWGAPVIDEDDPSYRRPPEAVPNAPPRPDTSARLQPPGAAAGPAVGPDENAPGSAIERRPLRATETPPPAGEQQGLLPPPPERFPPRVAPAKPKPVKRVAATPPKSAPLPRPRPSTADPQPSPPMHSAPMPPPPTPEPPAPPADEVPN